METKRRVIVDEEEGGEPGKLDEEFYSEFQFELELEEVKEISMMEYETQKWEEEEKLKALEKILVVKQETDIEKWQKTIQNNYKEFKKEEGPGSLKEERD